VISATQGDGERYVKAINLSASEAEDLVAKIWIAVERHDLRSPKITVFSTATKLEIEFLFDSRRDENLVITSALTLNGLGRTFAEPKHDASALALYPGWCQPTQERQPWMTTCGTYSAKQRQ